MNLLLTGVPLSQNMRSVPSNSLLCCGAFLSHERCLSNIPGLPLFSFLNTHVQHRNKLLMDPQDPERTNLPLVYSSRRERGVLPALGPKKRGEAPIGSFSLQPTSTLPYNDPQRLADMRPLRTCSWSHLSAATAFWAWLGALNLSSRRSIRNSLQSCHIHSHGS